MKNDPLEGPTNNMDAARAKANDPRNTSQKEKLPDGFVGMRQVCPACKGAEGLKHICSVCKGAGEVLLHDNGRGVAEFRTLDGDMTYMIPASLLKSSTVPTDEQLEAAQRHLQKIIALLVNAHGGLTCYRVPITHTSGLDGEQEQTIMLSWGRDAQDAVYNATHNARHVQWATLNGPVEPTQSPRVTVAWINSLLAIPIP